MSNWRDPDESRDYKLPSRKEMQGYDDTSDSSATFFSRIPIPIVILLFVFLLASSSLYIKLMRSDSDSNNKIAIALEDSLKNENFKTADMLTRTLLYDSLQTSERYISKEDFEQIGCEQIRYIDDLWREYSNNKFGFTAQIDIWEKINNENNEIDLKKKEVIFGKKVGWYNEKKDNNNWLDIEKIDYSLKARKGHLPTRSPVYGSIAIPNEDGYPTTLEKAWLLNSLLNSSKYPQCFKAK